MPATRLALRQTTGRPPTVADAATMTFDLAAGRLFKTGALGGNRTFAFANDQDDDQWSVLVLQDATGGRTVTWPAGITWMDSATGTPAAGANKRTLFSFWRLGGGSYLGWQSTQP